MLPSYSLKAFERNEDKLTPKRRVGDMKMRMLLAGVFVFLLFGGWLRM